jgi:hypothetical protein
MHALPGKRDTTAFCSGHVVACLSDLNGMLTPGTLVTCMQLGRQSMRLINTLQVEDGEDDE